MLCRRVGDRRLAKEEEVGIGLVCGWVRIRGTSGVGHGANLGLYVMRPGQLS